MVCAAPREGPFLQRKRTLHRVQLGEPKCDFGDEAKHFAVVNGRVGFVGDMVTAWGD